MKKAKGIVNLVRISLGPKKEEAKCEIKKINSKEAKKLLMETGLNLKGYSHVVDSFGIRHTIKNHGSQMEEAKRGMIAINLDDFKLIGTIISRYDNVKVETGKRNQPLLIYTKKIGSEHVYVEEIRTGSELVMVSMYKKKTSRS